MNSSILKILDDLIANFAGSRSFAHTIVLLLSISLTLCISYFIYKALHKLVIPLHYGKIKKDGNSHWSKALLKYGIVEKIYWFVPVLFIYTSIQFLEGERLIFNDKMIIAAEKMVTVSIIVISTILICAWLNILDYVYKNSFQISQRMSIRGYIELVKIISWIIAVILIVSVILNIGLLNILAGLGVLSAALLLIFKDTLLGLVSNIQLSAYDIIRIGDWIEIPGYNLNGIVLDITLSTIQVQNFDKSVVIVPTSDLLLKGVTNWRSMVDGNGRSIKKSIVVDIRTIRFCDEELWRKLYNAPILSPYVRRLHNTIADRSPPHFVTNTTLYRQYIVEYLSCLASIHKEKFPFSVHYLQPTESGLPIELYMFTNKISYADYEALQTEILDHLLSILPLFELRFFQKNI